MTQQEHQTYVPGQRFGEHDEDDNDNVAVGTAQAPQNDEYKDDEVRADEDREPVGETYPSSTYASGSAAPDVAERDDVEVVDRDEALSQDDDEVDSAYDNAVRENEVRDVEASEDEPDAVEEDQVAQVEDHEDREWAAEHATELRAGSTTLDEEPAEVDDEPAAIEDEPADEAPVETTASAPGSVDVTAVGAVWADGAVDGLRERWRELQLRFIDEPRAVAGEADALVGEAVDTITNALQAQRAELANWQNESGDDTERLRAAVRGYRDYLDRLLGM